MKRNYTEAAKDFLAGFSEDFIKEFEKLSRIDEEAYLSTIAYVAAQNVLGYRCTIRGKQKKIAKNLACF